MSKQQLSMISWPLEEQWKSDRGYTKRAMRERLAFVPPTENSGTLAVFCLGRDTAGQGTNHRDCPGHSGTVGNYVIVKLLVILCV